MARTASNWNLVAFTCQSCNKEIKAFPSRQRKYCSLCAKDRRVEVTCLKCERTILKHPSREAKYCSRQCWRQDQLGKTYPSEFGRKVSATKLSMPARSDATGRKRANTYLYPVPEPCEECGVEARIDRHHVDGNPRNNERSNISFLCKTHHQRLHKNWEKRWGKAA